MAKYVGKVFRIPNSRLGIRNNGTHYVHVTWYNPFKRKFRCKTITSLETEKTLEGKQYKELRRTPYIKKQGSKNVFRLFKREKYPRIRDGRLTPIPVSKTNGLPLWSAYSSTVELNLSDLKKVKKTDIKISK